MTCSQKERGRVTLNRQKDLALASKGFHAKVDVDPSVGASRLALPAKASDAMPQL